MIIRKTNLHDLQAVMQIYAEDHNIRQEYNISNVGEDKYPFRKMIEQDIKKLYSTFLKMPIYWAFYNYASNFSKSSKPANSAASTVC